MTKKEKKTESGKHTHLILMILQSLLMIFTVAAIVIACVFALDRTTREHRSMILEDTAKLASAQIDGDMVDGWLENGADDSYKATFTVLENVLHNTQYLQYLYVYQIREDGCHVVFDFDSVDEETGETVEGGVLGDKIEFDESWSEEIPALLEGLPIDTKESVDTFGWLLTKYEPVKDSSGRTVAYACADLSMKGVHDYVNNYVVQIAIFAALFLIGSVILGIRILIGARRADKMDNLIEQRKRDKQLTREIIEAFSRVVDLKDTYTKGHSYRVAVYTEMLARELGYDEETAETFHNVALMHDIGKIGIPDSILNKPGKLTEEEFDIIKSHTTRGYEVLKDISLMPEIALGARSHHERPDGTGYPQGLKQDEIPRLGQIIAVADCFDAMYSNRPYRSRMNFDKVVSIIKEVSGTQLTPDVVDAFLRIVEKGGFRARDDDGGGSMETIENIRSKYEKEEG